MKTLSGKITISRVTGRDENPVYIQIDDDISGCRLLQINMGLEDFAEAVLGRGWVNCSLEVYPDAPIGMKAENKTEIVPFDMYVERKNDRAIDKALAPFEVNGWRARRDDMRNGHCAVRNPDGSKSQRVVFFRHVDPETGKPFALKVNGNSDELA